MRLKGIMILCAYCTLERLDAHDEHEHSCEKLQVMTCMKSFTRVEGHATHNKPRLALGMPGDDSMPAGHFVVGMQGHFIVRVSTKANLQDGNWLVLCRC